MTSSARLKGVITQAMSFVLENRGQLFKMLIMLALIDTLFWVVMPQNAWFVLPKLLVFSLLSTVFAISVHRWIILGENRFPPSLNGRILRFFGLVLMEFAALALVVVLAIGLFFAAITVADDFLEFPDLLIIISMFVIGVPSLMGGVWIVSRLVTVYPHIATADMKSVGRAYALSRAPVWAIGKKLVLIFLCVYPPVYYFLSLLPDTVAENSLDLSEKVHFLPSALAATLLDYIVSAFFVSLASFIYIRLSADEESADDGEAPAA